MKYHVIDDWSYVVLHIVSEMYNPEYPASRNVTHWKSAYFPKVDSFTELRSTFTQPLLMSPNVNVRVWLEFPTFDMRSESRIMLYNYQQEEKKLIVGSRALTVVMEEGVVTRIFWDDTCSSCTEDYCMEDSCSSSINDLPDRESCQDQKSLEEDPYRCGIKIYVAWKGTDKDGNNLNSYTSLPSRFQKYSFIASAYDAAAGFSSDFLSFWKKPLN